MNYYETLGVPMSASDDAIKQAYRTLAMKHHPDRGGDPAKFDEINKAYEGLKNRVCPVCEGKGEIREKGHGAFVKKVKCPRCWGTQ